MKRGKNYKKSEEKLENKNYSLDEALTLMESFTKAKFDESVEVHVKLRVNPKKTDQQVRTIVELPHGTGKSKKIAVITTTQEKEAKAAGADLVAGDELLEKISAGKLDFDVLVASPEMMPKLAKLAKILGPRGLMPNPKTETVGPKVDKLVDGLKKGKASFKSDKGGNVHQIIGKRSFGKDKLKENFAVLIDGINKAKPDTLKGRLIKSVSVSSTMGPGIKVEL